MYKVKKRMEVAGAHRLTLDYGSKCSALHGHNWIITVYCEAENLDHNGMVYDFTHIKRAVHNKLDHQTLNDVMDFNPTAENIARWVAEQVGETCYRVTVQESEGNIAEWTTE